MAEEPGSSRNSRVEFSLKTAVFLAVVAVLVGLIAAGMRNTRAESPRRTSCLNNVRQIELAMIQYAGDYNDKYPSALKDDNEPAQLRFERLLTLNYLAAPKIFHCPSAEYENPPDVARLGGKALTDASLPKGTVAGVYLQIDWCSYGVDPKVQHEGEASRAVVADRPDPAYWGPKASSPGSGSESNSGNHDHDGQNVAYNDGHVKWSPTCADDSGIDPNFYATNPQVPVKDDSNIRYGSAPNVP